LFVEGRLAAESDFAIAVMIKKVVSKYLLPNAEREVLLAGKFDVDLGKRLTDFNEPQPS